MDDTERLVVLVEHLGEAVELLAHAIGPGTLGPANHERILEHARAAMREAHVIQANAEDHR